MKLTPKIQKLLQGHDLGKMNLLQLEDLLKSYGIQINETERLNELREYLIQLRKEQGIHEKKSGKGCGIDRDANPCGDASEY